MISCRLPIAPAPEQPGSLGQQFVAVALYLADDLREIDPAAAWENARLIAIPHARGGNAE